MDALCGWLSLQFAHLACLEEGSLKDETTAAHLMGPQPKALFLLRGQQIPEAAQHEAGFYVSSMLKPGP